MKLTQVNGTTLRVQCPDCRGMGKRPLACVTCGNCGSVPERTAIEYGMKIDKVAEKGTN